MTNLRRRTRNVIALLLLALLGGLMLRSFEQNQVYHPDRNMAATGRELGRRFEDITFKSNDGVELNAWFFPGDTNSPRSSTALLLCHGNAGNIGHRLEMCGAMLQTGISVLAFDYRGYGRSQGRPSEDGTYLDAQAAYAWLRSRGFAPENIIAYGESLGGGVAAGLACREKLGGLILQSTFTSIPDIGAELFPWLPVRWLSRIKYNTCQAVPTLKIPVLVMHSRTDGLIPFRHCEKNFAAANEPKLLWELKGDHNEPVSDRQNYVAGLEKFLSLLEAARTPK